ncbi:MAG: cytochrome c [Thermodesulfobacteriota bacterium]
MMISRICFVFAALTVTLCFSLPVVAEEKAEEKAKEDQAPKYEVSIELGRATYQHYCTPCHGVKGDGRGFNAPHLLVKPANHTDAKFMSERNDEKLFDAINLGGVEVAKSTLMPPWGAALGDERIKSIILHLRELCNCQATKNW